MCPWSNRCFLFSIFNSGVFMNRREEIHKILVVTIAVIVTAVVYEVFYK
jgi:hypothetical protein